MNEQGGFCSTKINLKVMFKVEKVLMMLVLRFLPPFSNKIYDGGWTLTVKVYILQHFKYFINKDHFITLGVLPELVFSSQHMNHHLLRMAEREGYPTWVDLV